MAMRMAGGGCFCPMNGSDGGKARYDTQLLDNDCDERAVDDALGTGNAAIMAEMYAARGRRSADRPVRSTAASSALPTR